jgi:hypothetical protein
MQVKITNLVIAENEVRNGMTSDGQNSVAGTVAIDIQQ